MIGSDSASRDYTIKLVVLTPWYVQGYNPIQLLRGIQTFEATATSRFMTHICQRYA